MKTVPWNQLLPPPVQKNRHSGSEISILTLPGSPPKVKNVSAASDDEGPQARAITSQGWLTECFPWRNEADVWDLALALTWLESLDLRFHLHILKMQGKHETAWLQCSSGDTTVWIFTKTCHSALIENPQYESNMVFENPSCCFQEIGVWQAGKKKGLKLIGQKKDHTMAWAETTSL